MKTMLSVLLAIFALAQGLAQSGNKNSYDLIIKNDKTEIKAKVLEIEDYNVTYKKFDNLTGPTYNIAKSDIFMILYANGSKETFDKQQTAAVPPAAQPKPQPQSSTASIQQMARSISSTTTDSESNSQPSATQSASSSDYSDFSYCPIRVFYNPNTDYDESFTVNAEAKLFDPTASNTVFSHFNLGIEMTYSAFADDSYDYSVTTSALDIGLYASWYFPINKLTGHGNPNKGLVPYTYVGGLLRYTDTMYSSTYTSGSEDESYTGDVTAGVGLDFRITRGFGISAMYDVTYGPGIGLGFLF